MTDEKLEVKFYFCVIKLQILQLGTILTSQCFIFVNSF